MKVFIGYDKREKKAFDVAKSSAEEYGSDVVPLYEERLRASGMLTRPVDRRGMRWDLNSDASMSTDFAISRFFVPLLAHSGWVLFTDADVVFMGDPAVLLKFANPAYAVCVVKHEQFQLGTTKMDGQVQVQYPRKLWSSVMLFNCDHFANQRLNLTTLNQWPGRDLHAFKWLADDEIGHLPAEANWLVGMQDKPERPLIAHYTLGTPDMVDSPHADIWLEKAAAL